MFYGKRIKELESRVFSLNIKVQELENKLNKLAETERLQTAEIGKLYEQLAAKDVENAPETKPSKQKKSPHHKPKKNGKENTETAE
jgi:regulator of replication initiation timing